MTNLNALRKPALVECLLTSAPKMITGCYYQERILGGPVDPGGANRMTRSGDAAVELHGAIFGGVAAGVEAPPRGLPIL